MLTQMPADADFDRRAASQGGSSTQRKEHMCHAERKRPIGREREGGGPSRIAKGRTYFQLCLEQREVWGPNEQRDVRCRLHGRDQDAGLVSFIVDDDEARQPAFGSVTCAVFSTAADGTVMVPVINLSRFGLAADQGDAVLGARALGR